MNKHISGSELETPKVTTGPLPASRKIYSRPAAAPDLRVPTREIALTEGSGEPPLPVYDTTGPYTNPDVAIDRARIRLAARAKASLLSSSMLTSAPSLISSLSMANS